MRSFALIGSGISHSRSPELYRSRFGKDCGFSLLDSEDFLKAWQEFLEGPYTAANITAPFKGEAARVCASDPRNFISAEVSETEATNLIIKEYGRLKAYNTDCLGVRRLLSGLEGVRRTVVIGGGGAGRAALWACRSLGLETSLKHHDALGRVESDLIVYTLPCRVECTLECKYLLEANYKNPCFEGHPGYISGLEWLRAQAEEGFKIIK